MSVPCSKCDACLAAKASQWAVRCYCESLLHDHTTFLTLTYDDEHYPKDGFLVRDHLRRFHKRAGILYPRSKFFSVGEYGGRTGRAHYHSIFFGGGFLNRGWKKWDDSCWTSPMLDQMWPFGLATLSESNMESICYTVGYVAKKIQDPSAFHLMSRHSGGIARDFLITSEDDIRRTGVVTIQGREYPLPKYFFNVLDLDDIKSARKASAPPVCAVARANRYINAKSKHQRTRGVL